SFQQIILKDSFNWTRIDTRLKTRSTIESAGSCKTHSTAGAPSQPLSVPELTEELTSAVNKCSRRAQAWRVPPNWSADDWNRELEAQAAFAALRAELQYDYSRRVSMKVFLNSRVIADLLTRYRQECRYALRVPPFTAMAGGER